MANVPVPAETHPEVNKPTLRLSKGENVQQRNSQKPYDRPSRASGWAASQIVILGLAD